MSAAAALSWEVFARYRWLYRLSALYFVAVCAAVSFLPAEWRGPQLGAWLAVPLLVPAVTLVAGVAHGN